MRSIYIGLIIVPDVPKNIIKKSLKKFKHDTKIHFPNVQFIFEIKEDMNGGTAEEVNKNIDYAYSWKKEKNWDYSIAITDLPIYKNKKMIISNVNALEKSAMISLPSLSIYRLKSKLFSILSNIIYYFYTENYMYMSRCKLPHVKVASLPSNELDSDKSETNHFYNSKILGFLKITLGMTFANKPWQGISSFKKIIALGLATGSYISIFYTPWQLSVAYSLPRFFVFMLFSLVSIVIWLVHVHKFWEKPSSKNKNSYRLLYNLTTLLTMFTLTSLSYIILFLLLLVSIFLFVPDDLFVKWGNANKSGGVSNYLRLSWFVTSAGLLAGALGSVMENDKKMKQLTYTTRQYERSKKIK
ncbi:5,10-methylene-tetrahydrofolate dehydrogenase [Staphylococcus gallinarum]|uniref:5,10-methylene-tetrahydrofolate dehydrogenase n=1 Tax=Staphylococcus gallinarum TaxID=1293 RepID=UPI001E57CBE2|nr:5,10-methylene-tetrahydrofolate dehydrogenase [Staphylococcus gallinarum]MCD8787431.1 5,10-methylene-tetrahydrofolate dehydrogenase [Staphylococcus gallinarum]MCD8845237.1 5,10-methylene-tetrahydrofolate dehydrogenase [Staphylococcus gallinarum]